MLTIWSCFAPKIRRIRSKRQKLVIPCFWLSQIFRLHYRLATFPMEAQSAQQTTEITQKMWFLIARCVFNIGRFYSACKKVFNIHFSYYYLWSNHKIINEPKSVISRLCRKMFQSGWEQTMLYILSRTFHLSFDLSTYNNEALLVQQIMVKTHKVWFHISRCVYL